MCSNHGLRVTSPRAGGPAARSYGCSPPRTGRPHLTGRSSCWARYNPDVLGGPRGGGPGDTSPAWIRADSGLLTGQLPGLRHRRAVPGLRDFVLPPALCVEQVADVEAHDRGDDVGLAAEQARPVGAAVVQGPCI